jgi:outer membrane protein OmpA-like peptidoglycan-associated protein
MATLTRFAPQLKAVSLRLLELAMGTTMGLLLFTLSVNPDAFAVLAGFTDNAGNEEYNLKLSRMRSQKVKNFILEQIRIDPDRVILFWYANTNPIASNDIAEGRKKNRRVEIAIGGMK